MEKEDLYRQIFKKVDVLLFMIPLKDGYLSESEISDFYMQQRPKIKEIVECYVVSHVPFIRYLGQVLRKRALIYSLHQYRKKEKAAVDSYTDISIFSDESYIEMENGEEEEEEEDHFAFTGCYDGFTLTDISYHIIYERSYKERRSLTRIEKEMKSNLLTLGSRKAFVILLLSMPSTTLAHKSLTLSKMLCCDEEAMLKLLELKEEFQQEKKLKIEENRAIAMKHFKAIIRNGMKKSFCLMDDEMKTEFEIAEEKSRKRYKSRIHQMRTASKGLSQSDIAAILYNSRNNINREMKIARQMLEKVTMHVG